MATEQVVYDGPHAEVEIPAAQVTAKRGEPVDVPADVAKALKKQSTWKAAPSGASKPKVRSDR